MSKYDNLHAGDCIRTFTGLYMNVFEPTPDMIHIDDIAHALSNQPRFAGHLKNFYSVAEHSVLVSKLVPDEYKLQALLHDASEAYLLDIPSPIKRRLPEYKILEDNLMKVIAEKFQFEYPLNPIVKAADKTALEREWDYYVNDIDKYDFRSWLPAIAKGFFIYNYKSYITPFRPTKQLVFRR